MLKISLIHAAVGHFPIACAVSAAVGVLAHVIYFIHGNRNLVALRIFLIHLSVLNSLLVWASFVLEAQRASSSGGCCTGVTSRGCSAAWSSTGSSSTRLGGLRGGSCPRLARFTTIGLTPPGGGGWVVVHGRLERGHDFHGDFLRTGAWPIPWDSRSTLPLICEDAMGGDTTRD